MFPYAVSLEQVTVDNPDYPTKLVKGITIGISPEDMISGRNAKPELQLTCGYRRNGQRFGDPHATFYNPKLAEGHPHRMQVAAFLSVESADNPLCKVLDKMAIAPQ